MKDEKLIFIKKIGKKNPTFLFLVWDSKNGLRWKQTCSSEQKIAYEKQIIRGKGSLQAKFIVPPVNVIRLDHKEMIDRRLEWGKVFTFKDTDFRINKGKKYGEICKHVLPVSEYSPVLMELICSWYCGFRKRILDPFAGGPYKGLVASMMGCYYTGIEIRAEQVAHNQQQASNLQQTFASWIYGDSMNLVSLLPENQQYDLLFSCPPYGSTEIYSELDGDLSNQSTDEFWNSFSTIMILALRFLTPNAFVVLQVSNFQTQKGELFPFEAKIITLLTEQGLQLFSSTTIIRRYGDAHLRCGKLFEATRKSTKISETLLVFSKGSVKELLQLPEYNVFVTPLGRGSVSQMISNCATMLMPYTVSLPSIQSSWLNLNEPPYDEEAQPKSVSSITNDITQQTWSEFSRSKRKRIHGREKRRKKKLSKTCQSVTTS